MEQNYKGLSNIGATCYMNSLLQTLYMTPQFRQAIYTWKYNDRVHPKPEDSILFQLQKLFGKLDKKFPGQITTRDLIKSFQWQDEQAQMQQDIQQFNRVLFEALQKSLKSKKQAEQSSSHFLSDLYQGQMMHYTHCQQCQNQSQRQQCFQDLLLTVKNPFQKVYNNCVQLGLQRYMKPQILDQNNLYKCQACGKMVPAERGVRFLRMPKLLNIILRRFDFDYFTFQRIKVNDRVQFPHILNMNNYMQGYSQIQNKLNEDTSAYFIQKQVPKKNPTSNTFNPTYKKVVTKKSGTPNVAGKITTKPSANTKSFLAQMRKKKTVSMEQNEDLLYVSGNSEMSKNSEPENKVQIAEAQSAKLNKKTQQNKVSEPLSASLPKNEPVTKQPTVTNLEQKQPKLAQNEGVPLVPPILNLPIPQISQPYLKSDNPDTTLQKQLAQKLQQRKIIDQNKQTRLKQQKQKNDKLIEQYFKEGSLVYELYAVLVHNGSATHGHYFSYIKSYENNHWYCFNDDRVSQINVDEIEKTFGGIGHSNAYALYYRQISNKSVEEERRQMSIPSYIQRSIEQQIQLLKQKQKQKVQNLQNMIILKVYYQLAVKVLEINKSSTMELVLLKTRQMFDIPQHTAIHNSRLRMFNPVSETKLQTFGGRETQTLQQLKISSYKNLLLEIKKQQQVFEQFILGKINIRIALWQQCKDNLKSLDQAYLKLHKISITKGAQMRQVQKVIQQKRRQMLYKDLGVQENIDNICIVKRHQNDEYSYHEIINLFDYKDKNVDQLMVMENQILFVQPDSNKLMWPEQFQNQIYRITIKYVNGETGHVDSALTDARKTIGELKNTLCEKLKLQPSETIIKRGNKSGLELKNLSATMKDSRFISGTQVYLEKGLPAKPGQIRIQLFIATDAADDCYNRLHEFQFVADVPINGQCKASQVKELFCTVLKKYKNIELKSNQFRIREKVCDKIGKIYRERPMKEQQLIEKREIAIQVKSQTIDEKEYLVYVRVWNPETWSLSKKIQINVSKLTTMKDLAQLIYQVNNEVPIQEMQICRILSLNKFNILDLCEMEYFEMSDVSVISQPLFVNTDGLMFVVKSSKKEPRTLTKEEQTKFGGNIKPFTKTVKGRQPNTTVKKQKGVSIKVIENKQQEEVKQEVQHQLQNDVNQLNQ